MYTVRLFSNHGTYRDFAATFNTRTGAVEFAKREAASPKVSRAVVLERRPRGKWGITFDTATGY